MVWLLSIRSGVPESGLCSWMSHSLECGLWTNNFSSNGSENSNPVRWYLCSGIIIRLLDQREWFSVV